MSVDNNSAAIATALKDRNAVAVSDGSFKCSQGTAACFIVEGTESDGGLVGVSVMPGEEVSQSPRLSKLGSVAGTLA